VKAQARDSLLDRIDALIKGPDALEGVAQLLAEEVGDACAIASFRDGLINPIAFGHADKQAIEMLRSSYPPTELARSRMAQLVLTATEPILISRIDPREFRTISATPYAEERGVYSIAMAGIRGEQDSAPIGVVSISREHPGAPYGDGERDLIGEVARRLAAVI
jgi:hypothetical protein